MHTRRIQPAGTPPLTILSSSPRMNTKQGFEWTKGTRERERERQGTRAFQLNRFPWVFRGLQVPRNRRTRPGTHDQYVGEVGGLLQRPPPVLPSSPPWTPSLSHVCEEDYYYAHVCARLSPPPARVFRGTLADLSLSATRGNCVTRRNWSTGDVRSTSLFVLC